MTKQEFIDKWKYQSMPNMGRAQMDCSEQMKKDLDAIIENEKR